MPANWSGRSLEAVTAAVCTMWHLGPAATWLPRVRRYFPVLAGEGRPDHVALTFDDGPAAASTRAVLSVLDTLGLRATFFMLGCAVAADRALAAEVAAAGHELAVHGWDHRYLLGRSRRRVREDLARTRDLLGDVGATPPVWFRPAYGVLTGPALAAARELELRPVLWTVWGRDWDRDATGGSVVDRVSPGLRGGATVLLHDARAGRSGDDVRASATVSALPRLAALAHARGLMVGRLADHGVAQRLRPIEPDSRDGD